jgi:hypothetical protein
MSGRDCDIDTFDANTVTPYHIGPQNICCVYCGALGFKSENKGTRTKPHLGKLCCNQGKIKLPFYCQLPPDLRKLMTSDDPRSKYFRKHIRKFNSGMAMASLQVEDRTVNHGGPSAFTISGQMVRRIGPLLASEHETPKCLQIYYDPALQAELRLQHVCDHILKFLSREFR